MAFNSAFPFDTVVFITDTIGPFTVQGSGVLIAPDEVLTATHVVFSSQFGTATNVTVTPAYNMGTAPFGSAAGTDFHFNNIPDDPRISNANSQLDFAVIHLSQPFTNVGIMGLEPNFPGGQVNIDGFPASAGGALVNSVQFVTRDPNFTIFDGTDLGDGSSGGPLWVDGPGGVPDAVGLISSGNSSGAGFFVQLTSADVNQITAWEAQDHGVSANTITITMPQQVVTTTPGSSTVVTDASAGGGAVFSEGNDTVNCGAGPITIVGVNPGTHLAVNTGSGNAVIFTGPTSANVGLGTGANIIVGGSGPLSVVGAAQPGGSDTIFASSGALTNVAGGDERMLFVGGFGPSVVTVGAGGGAAFAGEAGSVLIAGASGAFLAGNIAGDQLLTSGVGGDILAAGNGNETLNGAAANGSDLMFGGSGADAISLGHGADTLVGGSGGYVAFAGSGNATMFVGAAPDTFAFAAGRTGGNDVIGGFRPGVDHLALGGYTAPAAVFAGNGSSVVLLGDGTHITLLGVSTSSLASVS